MKAKILLPVLIFPNLSWAAIDPVLDAADKRMATAPVLMQAIEARDAKVRERAAVAWGRIQDPKSINPLGILATMDKDPKVRAAAVFGLGQMGWKKEFSLGKEEELRKLLNGKLKDKDSLVRLRAVEAFGKGGLETTPEVMVPFLSDSDKKIRAAAAYAMFRHRMVMKLQNPEREMKELAEPVYQALIKLAADKDTQVRQNLAYYFARNSDPRAEKVLAPLTKDKDQWTRLFAVMGLAKMKAKNSVAEYERALNDDEAHVRVAALNGLFAAGNSLVGYAGLMKDKSYHVRVALAQGLDMASLEILLNKDESAMVRAAALKTLAGTKTDGLAAWLTEFMSNPDWVIREAAVQASEKMPEKEREKFLIGALEDKNPNVRGAALELIGKIESKAAFAQLEKAAESNELIVRGLAVSALKDRKESAVKDLMKKTYENSADPKWEEMREEIREYFAKNKMDVPKTSATILSFTPFREQVPKKNPKIRFKTKKGDFTVECFAKDSPIHCADLAGNVKKGYYNGLIWHRVVSNFVIQGGDPDGTGWGGAGYALRAEVNTLPYKRGSLGMPRSSGFDTGGSQLFFTYIPTPHLDGQYTMFGQVTKGMDVVDQLERGDEIVKAELL